MRFCFEFEFWSLFVVWALGFEVCAQETKPATNWPRQISVTYGFELMADHNGVIIVAAIDSTLGAYKLGMRPGMEILAWNTLPIKRKLDAMKVRKYKKLFPLLTDEKIKLMILTRGRPGESAEVYFMTATGNNRGIRVTAEQIRQS